MRCSKCDDVINIYGSYFSRWQRLFCAIEVLYKEECITTGTFEFLVDLLCDIKKPIEDYDERENNE